MKTTTNTGIPGQPPRLLEVDLASLNAHKTHNTQHTSMHTSTHKNTQEARRTAEFRVSTLEDRLLSLGREEEKESKAEAEAAEKAARTARGKV